MEDRIQNDPEQEKRRLLKEKLSRRNRRALVAAITIFAAYSIHLYFAHGNTFSYFRDLLSGDIITISSTVLTLFTLTGWTMLYFAFRKYF